VQKGKQLDIREKNLFLSNKSRNIYEHTQNTCINNFVHKYALGLHLNKICCHEKFGANFIKYDSGKFRIKVLNGLEYKLPFPQYTASRINEKKELCEIFNVDKFFILFSVLD
jgi:hypothetical protein